MTVEAKTELGSFWRCVADSYLQGMVSQNQALDDALRSALSQHQRVRTWRERLFSLPWRPWIKKASL
jgi:hypothetical protein